MIEHGYNVRANFNGFYICGNQFYLCHPRSKQHVMPNLLRHLQ